MAALRHFLEFLLNPFLISLLLLAVMLLFWRSISSKRMRVLGFIVLLVLLVFSTGFLPHYLTKQLEARYKVVKLADPSVKWVVVLSGGQNLSPGFPANDLLSSASIKRLVEGVRLFRQLPKAKLVLSGGGSIGEQPEAFLLAELSEWFAIPKDRVVLETYSINTVAQAKELVHIVHQDPFYLVTSAVHMPRSMVLCKKEGLNPIPAPTDFTFYWSTDTWLKMVIPNTYNLCYFSIAFHEILGQIWVFGLKGN
ncbi:YdcF family protein [Legionella waltersii]|uniref:Membrane protein n=1 Tax=Legionella waltersii TaxID=66969 RepID=A0A0W1AD45_9GAMM|nr:ElyC/SanA/YdcF family protein [Legionella waltersii]KTD79223.1 membrane protein [Legionella waltersii]SNV12609.1 membrane protein [Legionella waltersii]